MSFDEMNRKSLENISRKEMGMLTTIISQTAETEREARDLLDKMHAMGMAEFREYVAAHPVSSRVLVHLLFAYERKLLSAKAKRGADATHRRSRTSKDEFLKLWSSGKHPYKTKDAFASAVCGKFYVAQRTARKWLQGAPDLPAAG